MLHHSYTPHHNRTYYNGPSIPAPQLHLSHLYNKTHTSVTVISQHLIPEPNSRAPAVADDPVRPLLCIGAPSGDGEDVIGDGEDRELGVEKTNSVLGKMENPDRCPRRWCLPVHL